MSFQVNASMPTHRPVLARADPHRPGLGPMCATTGLLPALTGRRRSSVRDRRDQRAGGVRQHRRFIQADAYAGFIRLYEAARRARPWSRPPVRLMPSAASSTSPDQQAPIPTACAHRCATAIERGRRPGAAGVSPCALSAAGRSSSRRRPGPGDGAVPNSDASKAIEYTLERSAALTRFLDDGGLCMTNNAAERELRAIVVGRRHWTFAGSDEGGGRNYPYTLIATAKRDDVSPPASLADVLARIRFPGERIETCAVELARGTPSRRLICRLGIEQESPIGCHHAFSRSRISFSRCWPPASSKISKIELDQGGRYSIPVSRPTFPQA